MLQSFCIPHPKRLLLFLKLFHTWINHVYYPTQARFKFPILGKAFYVKYPYSTGTDDSQMPMAYEFVSGIRLVGEEYKERFLLLKQTNLLICPLCSSGAIAKYEIGNPLASCVSSRGVI